MRRACLLACAALAATAAPAGAVWSGPEPVDAGATAVGGIDLGRDGSGALVYVKPDGGADHVFVSRMVDGAFRAPERVDAGVPEAGSDPVVAAGSGGRLVVVWRSAGRVLGAWADGGAFTAPGVLGAAQAQMGPPDVDLAVQGTALAVFAADGDVHAVRLRAGRWAHAAGPLDVRPDQPAGAGEGRPRVAVGADGNGLVAWIEGHPDGRDRLHARRVTTLNPSPLPLEVSVADVAGVPAGAAAAPDVAMEEDTSFAWVTWRQEVGGTPRALARRLVGSLFEAPAAVDGGAASGAPHVAITGEGAGLAAAAHPDGRLGTAVLSRDVFGPWAAAGAGYAPTVAAAEHGDTAVVWQAGPVVRGRRTARGEAPGAEAVLGEGALAGEAAADATGDFAVALQAGDRVLAALWDEPPEEPVLRTSRAWKALTTPELVWTPGADPWGTAEFRVTLDGAPLATTTGGSVVPAAPLADGEHLWQVTAVDRRGQLTASEARVVRVDTRRPRLGARLRRTGRTVTVAVRARDRHAGVERVRVKWGDGTRSAELTHVYTRRGRYEVTVRALDAAGNVARKRLAVRVR